MWIVSEFIGENKYAIAYHLEGVGNQVVLGTGGFTNVRYLGETFKSMFKHGNTSIPICTKEERDEFIKKWHPPSWMWEQEQLDESLMSASL